jgi:hypothetical protein
MISAYFVTIRSISEKLARKWNSAEPVSARVLNIADVLKTTKTQYTFDKVRLQEHDINKDFVSFDRLDRRGAWQRTLSRWNLTCLSHHSWNWVENMALLWDVAIFSTLSVEPGKTP